MLNGHEWQRLHPAFFSESQTLICRADECLSHLKLISDDRDAVECLLTTLQQLAREADTHGVAAVCGFARRLHDLLDAATAAEPLPPEALPALTRCLVLMAWQLELVDPHSGSLALDDGEQRGLLDAFACQCGLGARENSPAAVQGWQVNAEQCNTPVT